MTYRLKTHWKSGLGKKLTGKLHVYVGASDTFFLTDAVMDLQDWATDPKLDPPWGGSIQIGAHDGRGYDLGKVMLGSCFSFRRSGAAVSRACEADEVGFFFRSSKAD